MLHLPKTQSASWLAICSSCRLSLGFCCVNSALSLQMQMVASVLPTASSSGLVGLKARQVAAWAVSPWEMVAAGFKVLTPRSKTCTSPRHKDQMRSEEIQLYCHRLGHKCTRSTRGAQFTQSCPCKSSSGKKNFQKWDDFLERTSSCGSGEDQWSGWRPPHLKDGGVGDPDGEQWLGAQQWVEVDLTVSTRLHKEVPGGARTNSGHWRLMQLTHWLSL